MREKRNACFLTNDRIFSMPLTGDPEKDGFTSTPSFFMMESVKGLEPILIFSKEPLKIIKEHSIKTRVFRMKLTIAPCHGREDDSRNGPDCRKRPCSPDVPGIIESANLLKNVNKR